MNIFYDKDADLSIIKGMRVAILGYGSQGHAHANNLKDSGVNVVIGLRDGSASADKARRAGLDVQPVAQAVEGADLVMVLVPDEHQARLYQDIVAAKSKKVPYSHLHMGSTFISSRLSRAKTSTLS